MLRPQTILSFLNELQISGGKDANMMKRPRKMDWYAKALYAIDVTTFGFVPVGTMIDSKGGDLLLRKRHANNRRSDIDWLRYASRNFTDMQLLADAIHVLKPEHQMRMGALMHIVDAVRHRPDVPEEAICNDKEILDAYVQLCKETACCTSMFADSPR
jgi:hypothetical protein